MSKILDGVLVAKKINTKTKKEILNLKAKNIIPKLAVVLVGDDPASKLYVSIKEKKAQELGIITENIVLDKDITTYEIIATIEKLNNDMTDAILIQLPLPKEINTNQVLYSIDPKKDVDGLCPENLGRLLLDSPNVIPPTPAAILEILDYYKISLTGKHVVIVGYGKLVGKPLAAMISLSNRMATLTICNHKTENLSNYTQKADILVSATGTAHLIKREMIKKNAIVIDAGTTKVGGKILGDVDVDNVEDRAGYITPSRGGIGPVTVAKMLENVVKLAIERNRNDK